MKFDLRYNRVKYDTSSSTSAMFMLRHNVTKYTKNKMRESVYRDSSSEVAQKEEHENNLTLAWHWLLESVLFGALSMWICMGHLFILTMHHIVQPRVKYWQGEKLYYE